MYINDIPDEVLLEIKCKLKTYDRMSEVLGISKSSLSREFKRRGLDTGKLANISDTTLIEYRKDNRTYEYIAKQLNVNKNTIMNEYKKRNIDIEIDRSIDRLLGDLTNEQLLSYRKKGMSYNEISIKLNVSKSLVIKEYSDRGIKDSIINRKYKVVDLDNELLSSLKSQLGSYEKVAEQLDISITMIH